MDRYLTIIFLTSIKDTVYETARTRFLNLGHVVWMASLLLS
jgi:hypothetical protein